MLTEANSAKIAIAGAMKTALANTAGQVIVAELEKKRDKTVWNVGILTAERLWRSMSMPFQHR